MLDSVEDVLGEPSIFGGIFRSLFGSRSQPGENAPLLLISSAPEFAAFVPGGASEPVLTDLVNAINQTLFVGSLPILFGQLLEMPRDRKIPLENGILTDEVAMQIDDMQKFSDDDTTEPVEDLRTVWLALHEGARLALENKVALSLIQ